MNKKLIILGIAVLLSCVGLISNNATAGDWIDCPECGGDGVIMEYSEALGTFVPLIL